PPAAPWQSHGGGPRAPRVASMSTAYRLFRALPGPVRGAAETALRRSAERRGSALLPGWRGAGRRPAVGPLTTAGPAARAAPAAAQVRGLAPYRDLVLAATHVLAEGGRAVLDDVHHRTVLDDLPALADAGVTVGVLVHGSEARDLRAHAERYRSSPFREEWDE